MTGHGEQLSRKQEHAIGALLTEPTISAAAAAVGIGEATLRRWMKLDDFITEYRAARRQVVEQATARLQQASSGAVDTLVKPSRPTPSRYNYEQPSPSWPTRLMRWNCWTWKRGWLP